MISARSKLRLIVNGDDYGRTRNINEAITRAHEEGVLTSASLMVNEDAAGDAVLRARDHPGLAVGLHLVAAGARSALAPAAAPHLVDGQGRLPGTPFSAGVRCFFSPAVRQDLRLELAAQFEHFAETGLSLSHIDGHYLIHLHPTVLSLLLPMIERFRVPAMRVPRDDLRFALAANRQDAATRVTWAAVYALLCRAAIRRLQGTPVVFAERVYGFLMSGQMHEATVTRLLGRIPGTISSAEVYFHPDTSAQTEPFGPNPGDLAALLSPRVRAAIIQRGAILTNYAGLAQGDAPCKGRPPTVPPLPGG
jgi:chitin disaccharide deacetylase